MTSDPKSSQKSKPARKPLPRSLTKLVEPKAQVAEPRALVPWDQYANRYYLPDSYKPFGFTLQEWRELNWILDHFKG